MTRSKILLPLFATFVALVLLAVSRPLCAADDEPLGGKLEFRPPAKLPIKTDTGDAERAIANFHLPKGLTVKLFAAEPMLANPNSMCVDEQGRVYVSEANRYHGGVLDVRGCMNWLEEDIACKTVADRVAMVRRHANEAPGHEAIDSTNAERIVLLQDTTGSGKADKQTVFSEGYNRIEDGLGSGVFAYHGNVYFTCIPNLYQLKDTKGTGVADQRKVLSTGYGVRYAFLGHDLHGLVVGPDHKLYFSIGDRAANAEAIDGSTAVATETGSVFRCDLDGKNLELFATGLRNPQELRFDDHGNLFTGDNNPDKGDPARWVYVTEQSDNGWRVGYQEGKQPTNGGPWIAEQIYQTVDHNNANYIVPPVAHCGAGPSGLAYYSGVGLPEQYNGAFFLVDFRGAAPTSGIWALKPKPKGATFELTGMNGKPIDRSTKLTDSALFSGTCVVDCEQGPDGSLYFVDWTTGWGLPMKGRVYRIVDEKQVDSKIVQETKKLINEGMEKRSPEELIKLMAHPDMRVRQEAQFAIAALDHAQFKLLDQAVTAGPLLQRLHAIWALGQIGRTPSEAWQTSAIHELEPLLADKELEVRCQAAKVLADIKGAPVEPFLKLAADPEPRARYFAAMGLGKLKKKEAIPALLNLLKDNADSDPVLRYGGVWALSKTADEKTLVSLKGNPSPSLRLAAVLALRKMESAETAKFLDDSDRIVVLEAARAIHDLPIEAALPELAALANKPINATKGFNEKQTGSGPGPHGGVADWIAWRIVNANYRVGTPEAAKNLASFAARTDVSAEIRAEALRDLAEWSKPGVRDRITNLARPLADRDAKPAREAAKTVAEKLADDKDKNVKVAAAKLMQKYGLGDPKMLAATAEGSVAPPEVRLAALETLLEQKAPNAKDLLAKLAKDQNAMVRQSSIRLLGSQPDSVTQLSNILNSSAPFGDQQAAIDGLGASSSPQADAVLGEWMQKLVAGKAPPEVQLELLDAAAKRKDPKIAGLLKQFEAKRDAKDPLAEFKETLAGGAPEHGRKVFAENTAVSCIRCHTANNEGGIVGPVLDGVGAKYPPDYLLESIVVPGAKFAPGYESVQVQTKDNKYKVGIVKKDDDKELVLLNADNQLITIAKSDIKVREKGPSVMPEGLHKALTKRDLRDLVAWLVSLKTPPKEIKHGT
jgi:quinoprotein glucose dehydrogenase